MATPELQLQLLKRLRKQNEASPKHAKAISPTGNTYLVDRVRRAEAERDAALKQLAEVQAEAVRKGQQAAAEIAWLRLENSVKHRSASAGEREAHLERQTTEQMEHRRCQEETKETLRRASMKARQQKRRLEEEVEKSQKEKLLLNQQVESLKSMISEQVRAKLEVKKLEEVEKEVESQDSPSTTFSICADSDVPDEEDLEGGDDLEFTYDGLDLCNLMPFDRAFRLAKLGPSQPEQDLEAAVTEVEQVLSELQLAAPQVSEPEKEPEAPQATTPQVDDQQIQKDMEFLQKLGQELLEKQAKAEKDAEKEEAEKKEKEEVKEKVVESEEDRTVRPATERTMPLVSGFKLFSPYASLYKYA